MFFIFIHSLKTISKELLNENKKFGVNLITLHPKILEMLHICIEQKVTPDPVCMLIGEFAYSLRSSLDNLAWLLALLTTAKPGPMTAFPIESKCPLPGDRGYAKKVANLPPQALSVIESLQPYKTAPSFKDNPLWQLNRLCNIDKHRTVAVGHIAFSIVFPGFPEVWVDTDTFTHAMIISVPIADKEKFQLNISIDDIVFGEPIELPDGISDFEVTMDGLSAIYDFVRNDVVPRFAGFFS